MLFLWEASVMWGRISEFVFGERLPEHIPERVRKTISEQQLKGEILVGWVQLFLVTFFSVAYSIAPKTSAVTGYTPVIWALSFYFLFTLLRLGLAYKHHLPGWFLMTSVVVDMGTLMVLIWSFHLQYEQPPSFYLKVPTVLYVFIFIAIRALRFEAVYIILAGAVAAAGWLSLMLYAIFSSVDDPMITMNFVVYMTSNSILIGAEVDKIMTIIMVTLVLAAAVLRAQRLMIRAVIDNTAAHDLSRLVSPEIAERITSSDTRMKAGDGEVRTASVMFTDIEGFSTISEKLPPGELMQVLNEYLDAVSEVTNRYGGVISQFIGDGMLITFNAARTDKEHAANAVRTAIGIQRSVSTRTFRDGIRMKTRCGINTGEVVIGAVGTDERLLFTVHGDDVNIAARLEQLNKDYGTYILATGRTVAEAGDEFDFKKIGETTVRGRGNPTTLFTLCEKTPD